jgi:hypothetical protein
MAAGRLAKGLAPLAELLKTVRLEETLERLHACVFALEKRVVKMEERMEGEKEEEGEE